MIDSMSEETKIIIGVTLGFSMLITIICVIVIFESRRNRNSQLADPLVE